MGPNRSGQALLELLVSGGFVLILLAGAGWILQGAWERGRCAHLVFETTRGRLSGIPGLPFPISLKTPHGPSVRIEDSRISVIGEGQCGWFVKTTARVGFRKLETMKEWR